MHPSQGMPNVDLESKYWGQQNVKAKISQEGVYNGPINGISGKNYNLSEMLGNQTLNLFLLPHSHLDPGWIMTFEEYYTLKVKKILENVIDDIWEDKFNISKKFTWCETSFLQRFWTDPKVAAVSKSRLEVLLRSGQFEIVGGGWVQHDESLTTYKMQIE